MKNLCTYVKNHGASDEHKKNFKKVTDTSIIFQKRLKIRFFWLLFVSAFPRKRNFPVIDS